MQIDDGAALGNPALGGGRVALGIGGVQDIRCKDRAIGQKSPTFLGVEIALAGGIQGRPFHGCGVEHGHAHIQFVSDQEKAIGQDEGGGVADVCPSGGRPGRGPGVRDGIVDGAPVGKDENIAVDTRHLRSVRGRRQARRRRKHRARSRRAGWPPGSRYR